MTNPEPVESKRSELLRCAIFLAESLGSGEARAAALQPVVLRCLDEEDVDGAAGFADSLDDPFLRDRLLIRVVEKCALLGDDDYGLQLAAAIVEAGARASALEAFALQKGTRGEFADAVKVAEELEHSSDALAGIAVSLFSQGKREEALELLERVDFYSSRVDALIDIAAVSLEREDGKGVADMLERASETASEIEFAEDQIRAYLTVSTTFIEAGDKKNAIVALGKANSVVEQLDGVHKDNLFGNIAILFLKAGSIELADRTLDLVTDKTQIGNALVGFSQIFVDEDEPEEALETAEEALAMIRSEPEKEIRSTKTSHQVLSSIAVQFARLGKYDRALELAQENPDTGQMLAALTNIAQVAVLNEKDEVFRQALQAIREEADRVRAFLAASDAKHAAGSDDEAILLVEEATEHLPGVPQKIARADLEIELAGRLVFYGKEERAREMCSECLVTISKMIGAGNRAISLCDLDRLFAKNGYALSPDEGAIVESLIREASL